VISNDLSKIDPIKLDPGKGSWLEANRQRGALNFSLHVPGSVRSECRKYQYSGRGGLQ
jgi:hypothetical protein